MEEDTVSSMVSVMFLVEFLISTKLLTEQGKCTNGCKRNQAKCDVDTIYDFKMKMCGQ